MELELIEMSKSNWAFYKGNECAVHPVAMHYEEAKLFEKNNGYDIGKCRPALVGKKFEAPAIEVTSAAIDKTYFILFFCSLFCLFVGFIFGKIT